MLKQLDGRLDGVVGVRSLREPRRLPECRGHCLTVGRERQQHVGRSIERQDGYLLVRPPLVQERPCGSHGSTNRSATHAVACVEHQDDSEAAVRRCRDHLDIRDRLSVLLDMESVRRQLRLSRQAQCVEALREPRAGSLGELQAAARERGGRGRERREREQDEGEAPHRPSSPTTAACSG